MSIDNAFREELDIKLYNNNLSLSIETLELIIDLWTNCYILHCQGNYKLAVGILHEMQNNYPQYKNLISETIYRIEK